MANSNKNLKINKYVIIIIVLGIIFFALFTTLLIVSFRKKNDSIDDTTKIPGTQAPKPVTPSEKYKLPDSSLLVRDTNFYKEKYEDTLNYLLAVYPTAKDTLQSMDYLEIAQFYNSLWFYYNCASSFNKRFGGTELKDHYNNTYMVKDQIKHCWQPLPGCGTKYPKLPYTPQGYIYSFKHFIDNDWENFDLRNPIENNWKPWILSNSTLDPSEITASLPGASMWTNWNGPGPIWMYQRAIYRMVYNTDLPKIMELKDANKKYKIPSILPGELGEFESKWNYPNNWCKDGASDNQYIEVTAASEPGLPYSGAITWIDGWPGSGIFFNVGKSLRARNKTDATFKLVQEMSKDPDNLKKLMEWYGSSDPYDIISNLLGLANGVVCRQTPILIWDSDQNKKIGYNICFAGVVGLNDTYATYPRGMNDLHQIDGNNWYTWCNDHSLVDNSLTEQNKSYMKNIINLNPLIEKNYDKNNQFNVNNIYNNSRLFRINNKCIDAIRTEKMLKSDGTIDKVNSYRAGRFSSQGCFDEAMTAMGTCLGYDSIQLIQSANGNGFWQLEILDIKGLPESVKNRDYSGFIRKWSDKNKEQPNTIYWRTDNDFVKKWMKDSYSRYSLRDPFDLNNDAKSVKFTPSVEWDPEKVKWEYNITCKDHISDMFTNLSIGGGPQKGYWDFCSPNGIAFGSNKDFKWDTKEKKIVIDSEKLISMKDENTMPYA